MEWKVEWKTFSITEWNGKIVEWKWNGKWIGKKFRAHGGMEKKCIGNGMESGMDKFHIV